MPRSGNTRNVSPDSDVKTRREAIQVGLAGLAALGVSVLAPARASAAGGDAFILGAANDSAASTSILSSVSSGATLDLYNASPGTAGRVLECHQMGESTTGPGVYCYSQGLGPTIRAESVRATNDAPCIYASNHGSGHNARGVYSVLTNATTGCAIEGVVESASGPGPSALVARILAGGGEAIRVVHQGSGRGMSMHSAGDGIFVDSGGFAISASAAGSADAVTARTTGTASALLAEVYDANNFSVALKASTLGKGSALEAKAWNHDNASTALVAAHEGIGEALRAEVSSSNNGSPAIAAKTVGTGCAIQAEGGRAQLYLMPASTAGAPVDGDHQVGEVFVDAEGKLYSCIQAGIPGSWSLLGAAGAGGEMATDISKSTSDFVVRSMQTGAGNSMEARVQNAAGGGSAFVASTSGSGSAIRAFVSNPTNPSAAVEVRHAGKGRGVYASNDDATTISPTITSVNKGLGHSVLAWNSNPANAKATIYAVNNGIGGVLNAAVAATNASAVIQVKAGNGVGVLAKAEAAGTAVRAEGSNALHVQGKMTASRSGKAYLASGKASVTVSVPGGGMTTSSIILCTPQDSPGTGVYVRYAERVSATQFKVVLNKACTSSVKIGWMVLG